VCLLCLWSLTVDGTIAAALRFVLCSYGLVGQAKRELARKLATIGADHAAEMSAAARRSAAERRAAESNAAAAEEALAVLEAAHRGAIEEVATLKTAQETEKGVRAEESEATQAELQALQEQNVGLAVRVTTPHHSLSRHATSDSTCFLMASASSRVRFSLFREFNVVRLIACGIAGCTVRSRRARSGSGGPAGGAARGGAGDYAGTWGRHVVSVRTA
jgi:hypothetical protein